MPIPRGTMSPMRLPEELLPHPAGLKLLGISCDSTGLVRDGFDAGWGGTAYPPPGYLPWRALEVGNGDTYGFYWPIGREDGRPIICTLTHDDWAILPVASDLPACIRLHLLTGLGDREELLALADAFAVTIADVVDGRADHRADHPADRSAGSSEVEDEDAEEEEDQIEFWGAWTADDLLAIDPGSPHARLMAARNAIADRRLPTAEEHLGVALAGLPEYAEAWSLLALVYRQKPDHGKSVGAMMRALTSPHCFGASDRHRLAGWMQRMKDSTYAGQDPMWARRAELMEDPGLAVWEELIDAYHEARLGERAVGLRIATGELMSRETVSAQERAGWSEAIYREKLKTDLKRAGLRERLVGV